MDPIPKVLAYITRKNGQNVELLAFEHVDQPEAGVQVPSGSIDRKETARDAVIREVKEESGLTLTVEPSQIELSHYYHLDNNEYHLRHVFHIPSAAGLPNEWVHTVTGKGRDKNLRFRYFWIPLNTATTRLAASQGQYVNKIRV